MTTNKIYKVEMITQNLSANREGLFSTRDKADKIIETWTKIVTNDKTEHYGKTEFYVTALPIDNDIY